MQSLPTEAGPLSHCSQCGKRVAASGSPTFVYGVGAVGYQSCSECGAKWRYLWQEPISVVRRSRRPLAIIGGALLCAGLAVFAVVSFSGSSTEYGSATTTKPSTPGNSTQLPNGGRDATAADYLDIFGPANTARIAFMQWMASTARATPRFEVNERVAQFVRDGRATEDALTELNWPDEAAAAVDDLVDAYGALLDDADELRHGLLYSPSYFDRLRADSQAVKDAATKVRAALDIAPV